MNIYIYSLQYKASLKLIVCIFRKLTIKIIRHIVRGTISRLKSTEMPSSKMKNSKPKSSSGRDRGGMSNKVVYLITTIKDCNQACEYDVNVDVTTTRSTSNSSPTTAAVHAATNTDETG